MELPELLTTDQAAKYLGLRPQTLREWRMKKIHLPYVQVGWKIKYRATDIREWMEKQTVRPT
jgi:excisionase family DNA binding protein